MDFKAFSLATHLANLNVCTTKCPAEESPENLQGSQWRSFLFGGTRDGTQDPVLDYTELSLQPQWRSLRVWVEFPEEKTKLNCLLDIQTEVQPSVPYSKY